MALTIYNNPMAATAARNLSKSYTRLSNSVRKLSSGLRVGQASDDAAGLAIRELMRAQVAALNQGIRNANDGISLIQTADGALDVIDEKLVRMTELAEQAATGTYNSDQRAMINSEYQAMASEITRIATATDFNGVKLLDGSLSDGLTIHFGTGNSSAADYYSVKIQQVTASSLGVGGGSAAASIDTQTKAQSALDVLKKAIESKDTIRASLGAMQKRLEGTISNIQIQAENIQAAESRISDIDVSLEMTEFVKNQILAQSAVAMLSQANAIPRMALQLISS